MIVLKHIDIIQDIIYDFGFNISEVTTSAYHLSIDYRRKSKYTFDDITSIALSNNGITVYSDDDELLEAIAKRFEVDILDGEVYI